MRLAPAVQQQWLELDDPIVFRRTLPSGRCLPGTAGVHVQVIILPTLRVRVETVHAPKLHLLGRYHFGAVLWEDRPSEIFPHAAQTIVGADVEAALFLFRCGELDPRLWTSSREALLHFTTRRRSHVA